MILLAGINYSKGYVERDFPRMAEQHRENHHRWNRDSGLEESFTRKRERAAMRAIKGLAVIDLLVTICLTVLLAVVLLPAVRRVHISCSADRRVKALFGATDKSGPAHTVLEENAGADYNIQKFGPGEECWLVLHDPNCDHQVIVFKTLAPAPGDDQTM
jgi:hypothetical protein